VPALGSQAVAGMLACVQNCDRPLDGRLEYY